MDEINLTPDRNKLKPLYQILPKAFYVLQMKDAVIEFKTI